MFAFILLDLAYRLDSLDSTLVNPLQMITLMEQTTIYPREIINTSLRLIADGYDEVAVQLYNTLPHSDVEPFDNPIVQELVMKNRVRFSSWICERGMDFQIILTEKFNFC